jgi:chromosome segregation ATPase
VNTTDQAGSRVCVLKRTDTRPAICHRYGERRDVKPVVLCAVRKGQLSDISMDHRRVEAEHSRLLAEFREVSERALREFESVRQERDALRHAAEDARRSAEGVRHSTIRTATTADALNAIPVADAIPRGRA